MPGRRKKNYKTFRDVAKDGASHFSLIHRSQRDPMLADNEASEFVLAPDETKDNRLKEQQKYGVYFDDDYDYMKHLKEVNEISNVEMEELSSFRLMGEEDDVVSVSAASTSASGLLLPSSVLGSVTERDVGILNMAAPSTDPKVDWDPDIVAALDDDFEFSAGDELDDDFVAMANAELEGDVQPENVDEDKLAYNFKMMRFQQQMADHEKHEEDEENAGLQEENAEGKENKKDEESEEESEDDDEGTEIASDGADYDDDDDDQFIDSDDDDDDEHTRDDKSNMTGLSRCSSSVLPRNSNLKLIDEMHVASSDYPQLMEREYGMDKIGALDGEDLRGRCKFEGDFFKQIAEDMESYKKQYTMRDIVDSKDRIRPVIPEKWKWIEEKDYSVEEERDFVREPLPGKVVPKYDVETIRSTLSRTKNVPKLIVWPEEEPKKKKRKEKMLAEEETASTATLPGLTLRELEQHKRAERLADAPTTYRPKGETTDEKRERKKTVKEYQKERRAEKKQNKQAFATQMGQLKKVSVRAAAQKRIVPLNT